MNLISFLEICAKIVEAWPQVLDSNGDPLPHYRPDVFAYIDDEVELDSDNMGKDERYQDKAHFFSRYWKDHAYEIKSLQKKTPAIFCWQRISDFSVKDQREVINLQFCLQENYVRKFNPDTTGPNDNRSKEQIEQALRDVRDSFVRQLNSMVYKQSVGAILDGWYPRLWLTENGIPLSGRSLSSFIQFGGNASTFSRTPDGGVIETYFEIKLSTKVCEVIQSQDFNY